MPSGKSGVMKEATRRVLVLTGDLEFTGNLHLINLDRRESDVLNDEKRFIHLTDTLVVDRSGGRRTTVPFVAINKERIVCVIPLDHRKGDDSASAE